MDLARFSKKRDIGLGSQVNLLTNLSVLLMGYWGDWGKIKE